MSPPQSKAALRDERRLVKRLIRGDERAFDTFSETYLPALLRFALSRLGSDRELANDLVQITMVKVLPRLDAFRFESSLLSWLCACCRNEIAMHYRKQSRAPVPVGIDDPANVQVVAALSTPAAAQGALEHADTTEIVHLTLDLLPEHYGRALQWKYFDDLPVNEIATRLELRPKAAESVLTRARKAFLESYDQLSRDTRLRGRERAADRSAPATRRNP